MSRSRARARAHAGAHFRAGTALLALFAVAAFTTPARAEAPTLDDLLEAAEDLRGDEAAGRERAFRYLSSLPEEALPAIEERLRQTRRQIIPEEDGYDALRFFRHAVGSLRADDMVDIAPGILPVLEERRNAIVGRTAERLLYLRSLEAIGTLEAQRLIGDVLALTSRMWRWERRRLVERHGVSLLPGLIVLRNHPESPVRVWARWAIDELGMDQPAVALQQDDPMLVAAILEAYGEARDMDSMEVVISYVGHPAAPIREAARAAMAAFAHNGIWQLREAMRNQLGRDADHAWGWERTARELYDGLDDARLAPLEAVVDEGLAAAEAGDTATATTRFDEVLQQAPLHPRRTEMARALLSLARPTEGAAPEDAERLVRRASLLAPDEPDVRAALLALEAEDDLSRGVLDAEAWREAARRGHPRAREVVSDLLDEEVPIAADATALAESDGLPTAAWLGLLLLVLAGAAVRFRRPILLRGAALVARARSARGAARPATRAPQHERGRGRFDALRAATGGRLRGLRAALVDRLAERGLLRRLALFRRLVKGEAPPPPPRRVSAREVVRQRYRGPEAEESAEAVPVAVPEAGEPLAASVAEESLSSVAEEPDEAELLASLDELLLTGAGAADESVRPSPPAPESVPVEPLASEPFVVAPDPAVVPPEPEARPQASDLASLLLTGANDERTERSSPGVLAAPQDLFEAASQDLDDAGDTQPDPTDPLDADATLAEDRAPHSAR